MDVVFIERHHGKIRKLPIWSLAPYMLPFDGMKIYEGAEIAAQIEKIRAEIQRSGMSHVGCHELKLLCPEIPANEQKRAIEQIAVWEDWICRWLPDGSVLFSSLQKRAGTARI